MGIKKILLVAGLIIISGLLFSKILDFEDIHVYTKKIPKGKEEDIIRIVKNNNLKELMKYGPYLKELNIVNQSELMTPVQLALNMSNYDVVKYFKESNVDLSKDTLGKVKGYFLRYTNQSILKEIISLGYPVIYNTENLEKEPIPNTPWISNLFISYMLYNPFQTFSESYLNIESFEKKVGSVKFYAYMENYILAFMNTDFSWEVTTGNKNFYNNFNFVDDQLDGKGYTRIGGTSIHYNADVYSDAEKRDAMLWKLSKFFHRRGEVFGNLFVYYAFEYLNAHKDKDQFAKTLWNKYSFNLKKSYNSFVSKWNNGQLPEYPYDKFKGKRNNWDSVVQIPLHLDAKYLKSLKNKLPLISTSSAPEQKNNSKNNLAIFESVEKEIGNKISKIDNNTPKIEIEKLILLINTSSFKYNSYVWNELLLKLTGLKNKDSDFIDFIIPKIVDAKTISISAMLNKIQVMTDKGLYEEAVKFYNHLKINGYLRDNVKFDEIVKQNLINGVNISKRLYGYKEDYTKLPKSHTYRRFLLEEDYLKLKFCEEEITIILDKEEISKIFDKLEKILASKDDNFIIQNVIPPEVLLAKKPDFVSKEFYKKILFMYSEQLLKSNERVFSAKSFLEKIVALDNNDIIAYEKLIKATKRALEINNDKNIQIQLEKYKKDYQKLLKNKS